MLKKKQQEGSTWHQSEWPSLKGIQTKIAGEDVDKREASYAVGGTVNWCSHHGNQYGVSSND